LGGAVTARVVNRFVDLETNTGWAPSGDMVRLSWSLTDQGTAFANWQGPTGDEESELSIGDFADLRLATALETGRGRRVRAQLHYDRGSHLFRYNRVEGLFVGVGGRVVPPDPSRSRWELYATAGWALAEGTARGEAILRRGTT